MKVEVVRRCPKCGSAAVEFSPLVGLGAECKVCGWKGLKEQLMGEVIKNVDGDAALHNFFVDVRNNVAKDLSLSLGRVLMRWGFVSQSELSPKLLARYIGNIAKAAATAIIETRNEIEVEKGKSDERVS